jgi:hypothetical protein
MFTLILILILLKSFIVMCCNVFLGTDQSFYVSDCGKENVAADTSGCYLTIHKLNLLLLGDKVSEREHET